MGPQVIGLAILWESLTPGAAAPTQTVVVSASPPAAVNSPPLIPSSIPVPVPFHVPYNPQDRSWVVEGCKASLTDDDPDVRLRGLKKLSELGALGQIGAAD